MARNTLSEINGRISENPKKFIDECENRFDRNVDAAVNRFLEDTSFDVVLLAGPSSSGKTTTAAKIAEKIRRQNRNAFTVSLDDFYLDREVIPVNADGLKDFENVTALDIELIHKTFSDLIEKRSAELPVFDFNSGKRSEKTLKVELGKQDVMVVEGLHALNPVITEGLPKSHVFKIYISVSSRVLSDSGRILFNKRNLRLIRRTIRDNSRRSTPIEKTFEQWDGVLKGEDMYLFPFESYADCKIDSFHSYEPCIFKSEIMRLLETVGESSPFFEKAEDLSAAFSLIDGIDSSFLPENSLLNEFLVK